MTSRFASQNHRFSHLVASTLVILIIMTPVSNFVAADNGSWHPESAQDWSSMEEFVLAQNQTHLDIQDSDLIQIPANHTITEANLTVSSLWNPVNYQNTTFGYNQPSQWNGTLTNLQENSAALTLEKLNVSNIAEDFETVSAIPTGGWLPSGPNGEVWTIAGIGAPLTSNSGMLLPDDGFQNTSFLATTGNGDLGAGIDACILSPIIDVPRVINNYTLTFQQWLALDISDSVELSYLNGNQVWTSLPLPISSNSVSDEWEQVNISLDGIFTQPLTTTNLQFCVSTSQVNLLRGGWFIDQLELFNEGDQMGAWFHGNFSGDYLPYAASEFIIPANLSNFPYLDELEINLDWDIQGYLHDYLYVEFSFDNGQSWNPISGNYGIPGLGVWHNGNLYYTESKGWIPVYLPIVHNFTNSGGLNHTLFKFTVYTNAGINFGGATSSGWEGIALDQLVFHHQRGSNNAQSQVFHDFNTPPSIGYNSSDGWLNSITPANNQWQWTQNMGISAQQHQVYSFDEFDELPMGWSVSAQSDSRWEHGELPPNRIYGPTAWTSGNNGVGIALDGRYDAEMYTHLISPEYTIPPHSSARLSFNSWICTEANWDGGAVSVSTDGGINWWFLPPKITDFHDQISTANTNSPFYGEGILDGSTIAGSCRNSSLPFQLKQYEISNLSGLDVRFRFSFFADQLVELDGWYIDDAGIEIDVFKNAGTWLSQPIYPDSNFGWGQIDGLVNEPQGTEVTFDVIDATSGAIIDGYSNLTLPIDLRLNPSEHSAIQVRAELFSNNHFVTPSLSKLEVGVASYFDSYHAKHMIEDDELIITEDGHVTASSEMNILLNATSTCPTIDTRIVTVGENVAYSSNYFSVDYDLQQEELTISEFSNQHSLPTINDIISISLDETSTLHYFHYMPSCVLPTRNLTIALEGDGDPLYSDNSFLTTENLHHATAFTSVEIDDTLLSPDADGNYLLTLEPNQQLNLTYDVLTPLQTTTQSNNITSSIYLELEASSGSGILYSAHNSQQLATYSSLMTNHNIISENDCNNKVINSLSINTRLSICAISLHATASVDVKLIGVNAVASVSEFTVNLNPLQLNIAKHEVENISLADVISLPISVTTEFGATTTAFDYQSYLHHVDSIDSINRSQWLPGQELGIATSHIRFNPLTMSEIGYAIDRVELMAAATSSLSDIQFAVEVSGLYSSSPTFSIKSGASKLSLNQNQSTVSCNHGYCLIYWVLQSNWLLNDIDDIVWLVTSTDDEGGETGPNVLIRETQFNEVENDLEVFELSVLDEDNIDISDWTNQNWPFRLSDNATLQVNGKIRFEGISDADIGPNDAEVEVRLTATSPSLADGVVDSSLNWTVSWFTEVTASGLFSVPVSTPAFGQIPSNTSIVISAHISRVGPEPEVNSGAVDRTSVNMKTRFIFDTANPVVKSVSIYDPAGLTPADGHIWTLNQDIPIQVTIEDMEGLDTELVVYTWAEYADDLDADGMMDEAEYRVTTVSVNYASNIAIVDIPAISWQEVKGPFESGRLSVVLAIDDLAGNSLQNGGDFGELNDYATIIVQDQLQTLIHTSALSLDLIEGNILPANQHTFTYSFTDFNGIDSLDKISLALVGRASPDYCYIDYIPRLDEVHYDMDCFQSKPVVKISQFPGLQKWYVETEFNLSWSAVTNNPNLSGIPSLKIFDDGQDLRLGTSYIRGLSWQINSAVTVDNIQFTDTTEPVGMTLNSTLWANPGDVIIASSNLYHNNTTVTLSEISPDDDIGCLVNGVAQPSERLQFTTGGLHCYYEIPLDTDVELYEFVIWVSSANSTTYDNKVGFVNVDFSKPVLQLSIQDLLRINSNQLDQVMFEGQVREVIPLMDQQLTVNWNIIRNGTVINYQPFVNPISIHYNNDGEYGFAEFVNLGATGNYTLMENDELEIWLSLSDNSGQSLVGYATKTEPLMPRITWFDFLPTINLLELRSDKPTDGETLVIATRIVNTGLESGNVTVNLYDDSGRLLEQQTIHLDGGKWELVEWDIEAWKTGDITVTVALENYSESESLTIEDVKEFESSQAAFVGALGLIVILSIMIIGGFAYAYVKRAKELEQYTKHHLEQIALRKRERHMSEQESSNASEEE